MGRGLNVEKFHNKTYELILKKVIPKMLNYFQIKKGIKHKENFKQQ